MVFVSFPWGPANVQVRIRGSGKHDHRARVPHHRGKTGGFGVEGPEDHPVGADGDWRARRIERVRKAPLGCAVQHVD